MFLNPHMCDFNSIKVQLKLTSRTAASFPQSDFNSIKVQLKREFEPTQYDAR